MKAPFPEDLSVAMAGVRRQAAWSFLLCAPVLGAAVWWLPRQLEFRLEMAERLAFGARASLFVVLGIPIGVGTIARLRRKTPRDNAGSAYAPPSEQLRVPAEHA